MEELLRVIVLGVVQGLTEFLPISSSGHLIIFRELFGWEFEDELTLDVALHVGTALAVLAFFHREWRSMLLDAGRRLTGSAPRATAGLYNQRFLLLLVAGSAPAAIAGLLFEDAIEDKARSPLIAGAMLVAFALLLLAADRSGRRRRAIGSSGWVDAVVVGSAQALALVPGVSRSGVTITAALGRDFRRQDAARFSFLLSTPIIVGAGLLQASRAAMEGISLGEAGTLAAGAAVAALSGWLAIHYLLRLVQASSYLPFVLYRIAAGAFVLAYFSA